MVKLKLKINAATFKTYHLHGFLLKDHILWQKKDEASNNVSQVINTNFSEADNCYNNTF